MPYNNLLPEMIGVSRNCGFTSELHTVLMGKLTDYELEVFHRWLQIVKEEKKMDVTRAKNSAMFRFR
jgi:hypothetical protein